MSGVARLAILSCLSAGLGFSAVAWFATRPPAWQAWPGESSIGVQVSGAAPSPDRVRLRSPDATVDFRGTVHGDRLRFTGLTPDTPYVLDWRIGPFTPATQVVRTLPPVLPALDLEVVPSPGELAVRLRPHDARLTGVELRLATGAGLPLERRDERFVVPIPQTGSTDLALALPGSGETLPLDLSVPGAEALLEELARAEGELDALLAATKNPSVLEATALDFWEAAPFPARKPGGAGAPALLARLRRLAPVVRAITSSRYPAATRWSVALATSRLACAEVLARTQQQPALGVLDWAPALVRFAPARHPEVFRTAALTRGAVHLAHPAFLRTPAAGLMEVVGGTDTSGVAETLDFALDRPAGPWIGLAFAMQLVFNAGPPVLRFPRAGIAYELPLVQLDLRDRDHRKIDQPFPPLRLEVWMKRDPADANFEVAVLEPTYRPRSKRVAPIFIQIVAQCAGEPPAR